MSELKPCKHCGGEAQLYIYDGYSLYCNSCQLMTAFYATEAEAIAAWNRRPPAHKYTLEELREMDGEVVWVKDTAYQDEVFVSPGIVYIEEYPSNATVSTRYNTYSFDDDRWNHYDKTWAAYDREPEEEL